MYWIFISVILGLAVYNSGFRRLLLWALGFCTLFTVYLIMIH